MRPTCILFMFCFVLIINFPPIFLFFFYLFVFYHDFHLFLIHSNSIADYNIDQNHLPSNSSNSSNSSGGGCCCSNNCVGNGKNINQLTNLIRSPPLLLQPQSSSSSLQRQELKQSKRMVLKSSFPKHILYYRIIGPLTMVSYNFF